RRDAAQRRLLEHRGPAEVGAAAVRAPGDRLGGLEADREGTPLTDEGTDAAGRLSGVTDIVLPLSKHGHRGVWDPTGDTANWLVIFAGFVRKVHIFRGV